MVDQNKQRAWIRQWQIKNRDKCREYSKKWRKNNPNRDAEYRRNNNPTPLENWRLKWGATQKETRP